MTISGWAAFWLLCAVYVAAEAVMYLHGHDTLLWKHKTTAELAIQEKQIACENQKIILAKWYNFCM